MVLIFLNLQWLQITDWKKKIFYRIGYFLNLAEIFFNPRFVFCLQSHFIVVHIQTCIFWSSKFGTYLQFHHGSWLSFWVMLKYSSLLLEPKTFHWPKGVQDVDVRRCMTSNWITHFLIFSVNLDHFVDHFGSLDLTKPLLKFITGSELLKYWCI